MAKILVVDDNELLLALVEDALEGAGYTVATASTYAQLTEQLERDAFDLILMDVHMPEVDGLAATRAIRALPGPAAHIPIIAMTADVLPEQVDRCRAAGMVDHVTKPINVERLYERLAYWLSAPEARDEEAA